MHVSQENVKVLVTVSERNNYCHLKENCKIYFLLLFSHASEWSGILNS